jgi:hypothetical protein
VCFDRFLMMHVLVVRVASKNGLLYLVKTAVRCNFNLSIYRACPELVLANYPVS